METTLTIPKNRIGPSLAVAGIGSIACIGNSYGMLTTLLGEGSLSTGANVAWLERALPELAPEQADDLYLMSIQRLKSLTGKLQDMMAARSDRDSILEVKNALSLSGIQLAKAMQVSRTALYQWIDESKTMRPNSRKRLDLLGSLSNLWTGKVGAPISRSPWVSAAQRARLAEILTSKSENMMEEARGFLEDLAALKPDSKPRHRNILEIAKERNWKKLPENVRRAQWNSRRPSARITPDPY